MNDDLEEYDFESYESETTMTETFKSSKDEYKSDELDRKDIKVKATEDICDRPKFVHVTQELLKEVQQELCLIKLCWPEVDIRKDLYLNKLPSSYYTTSGKEKLLAWYAENFRQQFHAKYPYRKPLLLMCDNECGVQKFVSTTIRRSTLPYPELYTWQGCRKFVSDYIEYEPLNKALSMPKQLRSPTWVLQFQRGNCFECATLLTSLLLGQRYNAFVVSGYASKDRTLCNMTRTSCPYLPEPDLPPPSSPPCIDTSKYKLKPPPDFRSQFLLELESKEKENMEAEAKLQEEEWRKILQEFEQPSVDEYWGHRIHAWVVILPERQGLRDQEISEPLFIEPSSGEFYKPTDPKTSQLYLGVESIWNDSNYWVNMQSQTKGCEEIKWDLTKSELWEHLLPGEPWTMRGIVEEVDHDISIQQDKHLDMPFSYVDEISISDSAFEKRYPNGAKVIFYKKTKVELYAPYVQSDGLLQRITVYDDYDYTTPLEVYETYANRSDNLTECRRNLSNDSVIDYYKRGRPDQCKEHRYFASGRETIDSERILDFYDSARFDGLAQIEMHPTYLTQHYGSRDDFLYYRHVEFSLVKSVSVLNDIHYRHIWKISEKYHRNERIQASKDIAIREFAIGENEIRLMYHYHPGQYTRATRMYVKPPLAERGERLVLNPVMTQGYHPLDEPERSLDLFYELDKQLKEEDQSVSNVREAEVIVASFLKIRNSEYLTPELLISSYDRIRGMESQIEMSALAENIHAQSQQEDVEEIDYLKPYLARIGNPTEINETDALLQKEECLKDYKQLLVRRANNILRKFDECTRELEKMQLLLTQSEDLTREEEEKILEKTNEINFRLHTLEVRLNRHKELAPRRYKVLADHLQQCLQLSMVKK